MQHSSQHDPGFEIVTVDTPDLGDRSYLIGAGGQGGAAAVVDPQRDIDRVIEVVEERGWTIELVVETHIHNDYVSGGLELARRTDARYAVAAADDVEFERVPVADGDRLEVGDLALEVVATPGHTPNHVSYVLHAGGEAVAAFTGGSVLYGAVGRTDLISEEETETLARHQHRSARVLDEVLPPASTLYPTHGFGSFCSSNREVEVNVATLADEHRLNPVFTVDDEDDFVRDLIAGYTVYPSYYRHMGPTNRRGPTPIDLTPPPELGDEGVRDRIEQGHWVVDIRERGEYAEAHRPGTVNIEFGDYFATYSAWVLPFDVDLTLLAESAEHVHDAQRALSRVGFDHVSGVATGDDAVVGEAVERYRVADFADLADAWGRADIVVVDARRDDEWNEGHLPGAVHIHLPELPERIDEVPDGEVWVHCAAGFRASVAASLLARAGRRVVLIDDEWDRAADQGLEVISPRRSAA